MSTYRHVFQQILLQILAIILFSGGFLWAAELDFANWYSQKAADRSQAVANFIAMAKDKDPVAVYEDIYEEITRLPEATRGNENERNWINSFLMMMNQTKMQAGMSVLEKAGINSDNEIVARDLASSIQKQFKGNPFKPETGKNDPNYYIYQDRPGYEIRISPKETSAVAKTLWIKAEILDGLFTINNLPAMIITHQTIAESKQRWNNFMKNVLSDQFPWETLTNGWLWEGTLAQPPQWQLRLAHPLPVMSTNVNGTITFKPRIGIEGMGIRHYSASSLDPQWGTSALVVLPGEEKERLGYGFLFSLKTFSFGGIWQDMKQGKDRFAVIVGVNLAGIFTNWQKGVVGDKIRLINQKLNNIEHAVAAVP